MRIDSDTARSRLTPQLDRLSAATWILLAALLPFELKSPLITLGPLSITNVELALYAAIGVWVIRMLLPPPRPRGGASARTRRLHWSPVHWAVLAWIAANVISAVLAPTLRGEALKFALRSATGALLFFAAADWAQDAKRIWPIALTLAISTLVSVSAGVIEVAVPSTVPVWLAFKTHVTMMGEVLRASGTFQYANTAAMFWEAALPIGLAAIVGRGWPKSLRGSIGLAVAVSGVILAIVLSASRAALIGSAVALLMLIGLNRGALRRWALWALISLIGFTVAQVIISPTIAARFRAESERTWYTVQIDVATRELSLPAAGLVSVPVTITNASVRTWPANGATPVSVSYHWLSATSSDMIIFDGLRTRLPTDLAPGEQVPIALQVKAPAQAGAYRLQIDLIQEKVTWFSARTGATTVLTAHITAPTAATPQPSAPVKPQAQALPSQTRSELWRVAIELWRTRPVFGIGPDNFRWTYGTHLGATLFDRTVTANSWYVETLVNTGLIGLASLIGLGWTLLRAAYRAWRTRSTDERLLITGLIAAGLAFAVHGAVDYFLPFTPTYGLFWLAAGLLTGRGGAGHDAGDWL